ncbi:hypothetical protein PAXRUDRAFT_821435 [Paxillus rubicundulus Ve08.2h10]|uniref:Uncharacterized protein n=1 Tax=Paxillus rubicundulus Ve08.2h10 TaxID=930991 RepID=A0A0D0DNS6_9AGAM|nr:hypothetical protein PAXRUDRAFT_821435 [Paxillus rubicundulus Ve08.2h10]
MADSGPSNSLGLDFDALHIKDTDTSTANDAITALTTDVPAPAQEAQGASTTERPPPASTKDPKPDKKKPYVNLERVKTGGPQREKLTEEELAERMQRIKEQNEKIKQRRVDVKADEDAFKKMQEVERIKQVHTRRVQEGVDRTREQNAQRKLDKVQNREWDSGKPAGEWKQTKKTDGKEEGESSPTQTAEQRGAKPRGGGRGGTRGRGRGRGNAPRGGFAPPQATSSKPVESAAATPAAEGASS